MKKLFLSVVFLTSSLYVLAQSQGISYQAIIIDQQVKEIPGIDVEGSYVPNRPLTVRFSILNEIGDLDYQEDHNIQTDAYGMINLIIGQGTTTGASPVPFDEIDWDGSPKDLRVEVSLGEATSDFTEFSFQQLTFVPYAYHRNITATGNLTVGGKSTFNGEVEFQDITVQGQADLNGGLNVNNNTVTNLSGDLNTLGTTNLSGDLNTIGTANLLSDLYVSGASTIQSLTVQDVTVMNSSLTVNAPTHLGGQVTIDVNLPGDRFSKSSYPLLVQGSGQGIAVTVNGSRSSANNFVSFWDNGGMQGRIEGQTTGEVASGFDYIWDNAIMGVEIGFLIAEAACTGAQLDVCEAALLAVQGGVKIAQLAQYNIEALNRAGVAYESTSGDYAEWLEKSNPNERYSFGDIVGVKGGKISKLFSNADNYMVVSQSPIVLGNMPPEGREEEFEKVAFIGQVHVKVRGAVNIGDYIIASPLNDGMGIARNADKMALDDYQRIVGVAWSVSDGASMVNVAVGINSNDAVGKMKQQDEELTDVKQKLNAVIAYLQTKDPSFDTELFKVEEKKADANQNVNIVSAKSTSKLDSALKGIQDDTGFLHDVLATARKILDDKGIDYNRYEQTRRLVTDENYLIEVLKEFEQVNSGEN